jgi:hypothetical protein
MLQGQLCLFTLLTLEQIQVHLGKDKVDCNKRTLFYFCNEMSAMAVVLVKHVSRQHNPTHFISFKLVFFRKQKKSFVKVMSVPLSVT